MAWQFDNNDGIKAKGKYLLNRIFPHDEVSKRKHPVVFRHRILYLFWVMYRPIYAVLFYRKKTISEIKRLTQFKNKGKRGKSAE